MSIEAGCLLLIAGLLCLPAVAPAQLHHALSVRVDPGQHSIEVQDTITPGGDSATGLEFALHPGLTAELAGEGARLVDLGQLISSDTGVAARRYRVELAPGQQQLTLRYRGRIMHALRRQGEEYARAFRETPGMIGPEGVFLSAGSFWYPRVADQLLTFDLELRLPPGWSGMSQGQRSTGEADDGSRRERWRCDAPQEEIYLIAGRFTEYRQSGDAVEALVLIALPSQASPDLRDAYQRLAESWQAGNREQIGICLDAELEVLPADRAVWVFGWRNRFRDQLNRALEGYAFADRGESVRIEGATLERENHAVVVMARQASNPEQALGWLAADKPAALPGLGRKLLHYGRYSYLGFRGKAPDNLLKGQWPLVASPMSVQLAADGAPAEQAPMRLAPRQPLAAPVAKNSQR